MPEFEFREHDHTYWLDGERLPGVSNIISPLVDYSMVPKDTLEYKAELGTEFHRAIHLYLNNELDLASLDEALVKPMEGFKKWLTGKPEEEELIYTNCELGIMEKPVYHESLKYAGTPDLVTSNCIYDWKLRPYNPISDPLQMAGYEHLVGGRERQKWVISFDLFGNFRQHLTNKRQAWPIFRRLLERWIWEQDFKKLLNAWKENCK